ncbi:MAG: HAMP domain-containing histidine kinase [Deltaproteobacteria bacterium]|nr:HAMP domain-containing histidine kinase [Deltaproteobacteria bacterium]
MNDRGPVVRWVLLTAILVAAGFLGWWTWQTTNALESLGERSVIESTALLVREKLDRVEQLIITGDNAALPMVDPEDLEALASRWPDEAPRISPTVRSVLVLDDAQRIVRHVSRAPPGEAERFRRWFGGALRAELNLASEPLEGHRHWHGTLDGTPAMVSYFARERAGRRYYVVLESDLEHLRRVVLPSLFDDPLARGRFNITDENNRLVYGRSLANAGDFLVSARFPTTLYKWRMAAAPRAAPELEARARKRRVAEGGYVGLSLLVILAGVAFLVYGAREQERLNRLKSDFIATVSHELKTPLSLIKMFGELLSTDRVPSPEKRRQYLDIIVRESERLTGLIENVLDFARVERGRASYEFAEARLAEVVARGVELFRYRVDLGGPTLVTHLDPELPPVRMDERALQLALFNLLDNAVKYARGTPEVVVRVRRDGRLAVLEVEDHGPGIDPEDARRVFERFYRGRLGREGDARGSGIGLALVKHIARAHGGDVTVHPAPEGGALFRLTLPLG